MTEQKYEDKIIRILAKDIPGNMTVYSGFTRIKGISWGISNAICNLMKLDKKRKIGSLTPEELEQVKKFMEKPELPLFMKNRRKDFESGEDKHIISSELELKKDFDIKRLKKVKSYRGFRHMGNLPLRGQRTRSNFRKNRARGVGIKKKGGKK